MIIALVVASILAVMFYIGDKHVSREVGKRSWRWGIIAALRIVENATMLIIQGLVLLFVTGLGGVMFWLGGYYLDFWTFTLSRDQFTGIVALTMGVLVGLLVFWFIIGLIHRRILKGKQ